MPAHTKRSRRGKALASAMGVIALTLGMACGLKAADCPPLREPRIPPVPGAENPVDPLNIDRVKAQLKAYQAGNYDYDIAAVLADARTYVERRADQVTRSAVVLDIDETSLSNWQNLKANDFGFIPAGACDSLPKGPCGFSAWIDKHTATPIEPTLTFFKAAINKNVAVFFITGRTDRQRDVTEQNLDIAGFKGYARLVTRPDDDPRTVAEFKTEERAKIEAAGYRIIANIGDQMSDLVNGIAECTFKVPNPFYFIP